MSKTAEELNALKSEVESLNAKLAELNEEELAKVAGGGDGWSPYIISCPNCGRSFDVMIDDETGLICCGRCEQCGWDAAQLR